jgi:hypothetical protein
MDMFIGIAGSLFRRSTMKHKTLFGFPAELASTPVSAGQTLYLNPPGFPIIHSRWETTT